MDQRVGQLIQATKDAGTFEQTNFVCLGDHYQIDVNQMIHLNTLFAKKGWLTPIKNQQTFKNNWRVMAKTCDGETYVYVRPGIDRDEVRREIAGVKGIEKIYDGAQAVRLGLIRAVRFWLRPKPVGTLLMRPSVRPSLNRSCRQ